MNVDLTDLVNLITEELTVELSDEPTFDADVLKNKVKNACRETIRRRNYIVTPMKESAILEDLQNYISVIENVALHDYNMVGAEFETSHNENGVNRQYVDRESLFNGVHAFVKVM